MSSRLSRLRPSDLARIAIAGALIVPPAMVSAGPTLCPFRLATGRPCPTCGMTRSWSSFAHLRLRDSLSFHPLGPLTFIGASWVAIGGGRGRTPAVLRSTPVVGAIVAVWLAVWLRRLTGASRSGGGDHVATE